MQPVRLRATCSQRRTIVTPSRLLERENGSYAARDPRPLRNRGSIQDRDGCPQGALLVVPHAVFDRNALEIVKLAITARHSERGIRMRVGIRRFLRVRHNVRPARVPVMLVTHAAWLAVVFALATGAGAGGAVGTSFPADFPVIVDESLGVPVIGFGAGGPVERTPVIFLHGNNDTPFPTACNPFGSVHAFAQFFA